MSKKDKKIPKTGPIIKPITAEIPISLNTFILSSSSTT